MAKSLISRLITLLKPFALAGGIAFSSLGMAKADEWDNDWENLRDWYLIQQGIVNPVMRYAEYELMRESINSPRELHVYHHYDRDNDGRVDNPHKLPQTFIANYWKDFNEDGKITGINSEIIGLNKKTYRADKNLIYGFYLPSTGIKGKSYEFKLFDEKGDLAHTFIGKFKKDKEFRYCAWDSENLSKLVERSGEGNYSVAFYFDGRHWNTREFKLIKRDEKNKEDKKTPNHKTHSRVISDPPEAFRNRRSAPPEIDDDFYNREERKLPEKPIPAPMSSQSNSSRKSSSNFTQTSALSSAKLSPEENFIFCVYSYWDDKDKDNLLDHNAQELRGWGLDQYNLEDEVTLTVSGFDNAKEKSGEFGIKNLEGKIVYKEPFTFEENNTSFLLTFNPRELKPGNYLAYSNINLEHGKYISTKEIKVLAKKEKQIIAP